MKSPHTLMLLLVSLPVCGFAQEPSSAHLPGEAQREGSQFDFSLQAGGSLSDNVGRVPFNEGNGTIARAGTQLEYRNTTRRLDSDIQVDALYEHYTDDTFEDNIVGGADAQISIGLVPERFLWDFQENFGQVTSDPFAPTTPENREYINYFTTGPDFIMQFGAGTSLQVSGRFSDVDYEKSLVDSQQSMATVDLSRQTSRYATIGFIAELNSIDFADDFNLDYDRNQAYARYQLQNTRTNLTVDAGYTTINSDAGDEGGLLARVAMERRISKAASLSASIGTEFSSSGDVFRSGQDALGVSHTTSSVVGTSAPFENRFATFGYDFERSRTGAGVNLQYRREIYVNSDVDRMVTGFGLYFSRHLSAQLEARIYANFEQQDIDVSNFDSDETRAGASLNWIVGRTVSLRFEYDRIDYASSDAAADYTENQASLSVVWAPVHH